MNERLFIPNRDLTTDQNTDGTKVQPGEKVGFVGITYSMWVRGY